MSDDQAPDAVSAQKLQELLSQASGESRAAVVGSHIPELPLAVPAFGAVDLVVLLEQVLCKSGGATPLHLLHASSYLLRLAAEALVLHTERVVQRFESGGGFLDSASNLLFRAATQALINTIHGCVEQIDSFVAPITRMHAERVGGGPDSRKGIVSDDALNAMGIDVDAYDQELKRRLAQDR